MFYYVPSTEKAYDIMKDLQYVVSAGLVIRNMHRWAAHLMVLFVLLHMCRVFYTGAYKRPREFNWVIGVGLFLLTLGIELHRLSPAVGPTRVLGDHRRHEHRRLCAGHRSEDEISAAGRERGRAGGADPVLRVACDRPAGGGAADGGRSSVACAQGRRVVASRRAGRNRPADGPQAIADEQELRPDGTRARHDAAGRARIRRTRCSPGRIWFSAKYCCSCS